MKKLTYLTDGLVPVHEHDGAKLEVIPEDLCTRCGVCEPICPPQVIEFDERKFPFIRTEGCIDCGLCLKVCPGIDFDYSAEYERQFDVSPPPLWLGGVCRSATLCASTRQDVRLEGSGGGVVTQILMGLLEEGVIDGAVTVGEDPDDPVSPAPVISTTPDEVLATAGSKYCVVPHARILREIRKRPGNYAFVGVGCQIQGLRKLEKINRRLGRREIFTIGLACHGTLEKEATLDVLARRRVPATDVARFRYRGGDFPGKFQAVIRDGRVLDMHRYDYKDAAYNYLYRLYTPERCHTCVDFSAEFTDLSVTDFWVRDDEGRYLYPEGSSLVLCRTERGEAVLRKLIEKGYLTGEEIGRDDVDLSFRHLHHDKRVAPFLRAERSRRAGRQAPEYNFPHPPATAADRRREWIRECTLIFSRWRFTRRFMVALFFSPLGEKFTRLNMWRKRMKWKRRAKKDRRRAGAR